ncbi:MAG: HAMP domain-containing histidine kinase [Bacteroidetes bacterium]|nr:HAMP domain-containing histidine kinase [Bacteroidota bacterium]
MKSNHIRIAVLLGSISVIGIIAFQLYWVNKSFDLAEQQFNQTIEIALYNVAEKMASFNGHQLPNENPVRQISSNYFIVDINDIIDASILDHYLKTEFEYRNIRIDYEYAIYDCETDEMVFGSYFDPSDDTNNQVERTFQKYDEFTYYFGIIFPSKTLYIIKTMNVWIISTFVLITALVFFAYAIFVILRQKRLSEVQRDFINNMTHEFKTPVSTIAISADVLNQPEIIHDPSRLQNYAGIIAEQNKRIEHQIEKVLQLARIDKKQFEIKPNRVNVHEMIHKVATSFEPNVFEKGGDIQLELQNENPVIMADPDHFINALYNLVDNAIKYCKSHPKVTIRTHTHQGKLHISVSDNGIGIEKKYQHKIFDKFYRVPTGNVHDVKGFGIGLNYVKSIVRNHHWDIRVKSKPAEGSTFILIIPLASQKHEN